MQARQLKLQIHTISEYAIYIAFPRHKSVRERASRSRYTYTACLVPSELGFVLSHEGGARDYQIPEGKVEIVCGTKFITQISPTTHLRHVSVMGGGGKMRGKERRV